jgi:hypothetical protein
MNKVTSLYFKADPHGSTATQLLNDVEPFITHCGQLDCEELAVRVGVFEVMAHKEKDHCEIRGLCERHKQMGMWFGPEEVWG